MSREQMRSIALSGDINKTSIIEVNCETDFVAKNEDFISFVKELSEINTCLIWMCEILNYEKFKNGRWKSCINNCKNWWKNNHWRSKTCKLPIALISVIYTLL